MSLTEVLSLLIFAIILSLSMIGIGFVRGVDMGYRAGYSDAINKEPNMLEEEDNE